MTTQQRRRLARTCQAALSKRLPGWTKSGSTALYRRTDDFVQWIAFEPLSFQVVRPGYTVQALAIQLPDIPGTPGDFVRTDKGLPIRIDWDAWTAYQDDLIAHILSVVRPSVTVPFTNQRVWEYLETVQIDHVDVPITRGIAAIILGDYDTGRAYLRQAYDWYQWMEAARARAEEQHGQSPLESVEDSWARVEERRIQSWLACSDTTILAKLRADAQAGAALLKLT